MVRTFKERDLDGCRLERAVGGGGVVAVLAEHVGVELSDGDGGGKVVCVSARIDASTNSGRCRMQQSISDARVQFMRAVRSPDAEPRHCSSFFLHATGSCERQNVRQRCADEQT